MDENAPQESGDKRAMHTPTGLPAEMWPRLAAAMVREGLDDEASPIARQDARRWLGALEESATLGVQAGSHVRALLNATDPAELDAAVRSRAELDPAKGNGAEPDGAARDGGQS